MSLEEDYLDRRQLHLVNHFDNPQFSDIIIQAAGKQWFSHKVVLSCQSKYFSEQLKRMTGNILELQNEGHPGAVETMLRYLYGGDYDPFSDDYRGDTPLDIFYVLVYIVTDRYGIVSLKDEAKLQFQDFVYNHYDSESFPLSIVEIYSNIPPDDRNLRDIVLEHVVLHLNYFLENEAFKELLISIPELTRDILRLQHKKLKEKRRLII